MKPGKAGRIIDDRIIPTGNGKNIILPSIILSTDAGAPRNGSRDHGFNARHTIKENQMHRRMILSRHDSVFCLRLCCSGFFAFSAVEFEARRCADGVVAHSQGGKAESSFRRVASSAERNWKSMKPPDDNRQYENLRN